MVDFAGWGMPVQYGSIVAEHQGVRTGVGLFDVSHMGRLAISGPLAGKLLETTLTRATADLGSGQIRYSLVTNGAGGILDDILAGRLPSGGDEWDELEGASHLLVVNASNREKIFRWLEAQAAAIERTAGSEVRVIDRTLDLAMIAVQGPKGVALVQSLAEMPQGGDPATMRYYHAAFGRVAGHAALISRTGYTGEDGFELIVPAASALPVWERLLASDPAAMACGLGCRDTLRMEAGMPLYGHELSESISPLDAGLDFAVNLEGREFPGADVLRKQRGAGLDRVRVGLELAGKRVPREQFPVLAGGETVGQVTSGTFSPTLDRPIAMAYVQPQVSQPGQELSVEIRGQEAAAKVVKLPFYKRPKAKA